MEDLSFGERLRRAFGNAKNRDIARALGVTDTAVKNYLDGRVPSADMLLAIQHSTGCSLDWLLTGRGDEAISPQINDQLLDRLRIIARDQAHVIFADAEVAGGNIDERTLKLLIDFLLYRSLVAAGLIEPNAVLSAADRRRAEKFSFLANIPSSIDDMMRSIINETVRREVAAELAVQRVYGIGDVPKQKTRKAG